MNVVITGASKGIGKAIAKKFAEKGYHLFLCARNLSLLEQTAIILREQFPGTNVKIKSADLSDKDQVIQFADWCLQYGTPSILINNAGVYIQGNVMDEAEGQLEKMMDTNLYSAYHLTRRLLPQMKKNGSGHIFNICSVASLHAYNGGGGYSITKFAMNGFSQNLRHELKAHNIKVTAVFPGAVLTDSWGNYDNSNNRIMEADDIASMVIAASNLSAQAVVEEITLRPQLGDL